MRGFALAVAILAIGMITTITVILNSLSLERQSKELTISKNAAELEMQRLRGIPYGDLLVMIQGANPANRSITGDFAVNGVLPAPNDTDGDPNQCGWFSLQIRNGSVNDNLIDITVRVRWRQRGVGTRTYELQSVKSDRGTRFSPTNP